MTDEQAHLRRPSKEIRRVLGENVRAHRIRLAMSQEELAAVAKLHRTYLGSVERAERNVTLSTLEAIATALDVPVPELLTDRSEDRDE